MCLYVGARDLASINFYSVEVQVIKETRMTYQMLYIFITIIYILDIFMMYIDVCVNFDWLSIFLIKKV